MHHFFVTPDQIVEGRIRIVGPDVHHMRNALRIREGEKVLISDGAGQDYLCRVLRLERDEALTAVESACKESRELPARIWLFQGLPKSDKMEWIIQKAVELGVDSITPVMTRRCVSKPDSKSMAKKLERYNRIALEAAKQSGRGKVPQVCPMLDLPQALDEMAQTSCPILFYENATAPAKQVIDGAGKEIAVLIGSEGGFDESEVELAIQKGCQVLSLGKRILRCETAPLAALSIIMFETGNM